MDTLRLKKSAITALKPLLGGVAAALAVITVCFLLLRVAPGDPAINLLKGSADQLSGNTQDELKRIRTRLGLNLPLFYWSLKPMSDSGEDWRAHMPSFRWNGPACQYHSWLTGIAALDFGASYKDGQPVSRRLLAAFAVSLLIAALSIPAGLYAGWRSGLWFAGLDNSQLRSLFSALLLLGFSTPTFLLAATLVSMTVILIPDGWLPISGLVSVSYSSDWPLHQQIFEYARHMLMPVFCTGFGAWCFAARLSWEEADSAFSSSHYRTAKALGLDKKTALKRWITPLTKLPIWATSGSVWAAALSGSVVVETIFSIPGIGHVSYKAALERDYPVLMGIILLTAAATAVSYAVLDIAARKADPRTR